jgi:hypothetical protein
MIRKVDEAFGKRDYQLSFKVNRLPFILMFLLFAIEAPGLFLFQGAALLERLTLVIVVVSLLAVIATFLLSYFDTWALDITANYYLRKLESDFDQDDQIFLKAVSK